MARIDPFLEALEEERFEIDLARRRRPGLGRLYSRHGELFSMSRIAQVQRELAGLAGTEERRARAMLEFLARSRAWSLAASALDQRLEWEIFGAVAVGEDRIPLRQTEAALAVAADPDRRHAIEDTHHQALEDQRYLAEDILSRHREGIAEVGYGSHVEAFQILAGMDLQAIARDGERFLRETEALHRELLNWYLPKVAAVTAHEARAADGRRIEAAVEYDRLLRGGERNRALLEMFREVGIDPLAEGRIEIAWGAYLGVAAGAVCRVPRVPERAMMAVSTRSGRPAIVSFLGAYGSALHHAYTDPTLPVEQRRLGDESVSLASGALLASLLRVRSFLERGFGFGRVDAGAYLRLELLASLLAIRREVGLLLFEIAHYSEDAGGDRYEEILTGATGLRHDARGGVWAIDGEFTSARRIRAAQLAAIHASILRNRFDEDWFRNPAAAGYLIDLFANGRRFSAPELAGQLSSLPLGFGPLLEELRELAG